MNYLDHIAEAIRQEVSPDKLPTSETKQLFRLYAVLALAKGDQVTLEDIHNAWSAWMLSQNPTHESLRPFIDLPPDIQREDQPYVDAVRRVATRLE